MMLNQKNKLTLMNCKQLAEMLGISIKTVYSYLGYRQFPKELYRKIGKKPIFIYEEVAKWFLEGAKLNPRSHKNNAEINEKE